MSRDHSLDEFATDTEAVDAASDGSHDRESTGDTTDSGEMSSPASPDGSDGSIGPIRPTYAFDADGGACTLCGSQVQERWVQDDELVCTDCKDW